MKTAVFLPFTNLTNSSCFFLLDVLFLQINTSDKIKIRCPVSTKFPYYLFLGIWTWISQTTFATKWYRSPSLGCDSADPALARNKRSQSCDIFCFESSVIGCSEAERTHSCAALCDVTSRCASEFAGQSAASTTHSVQRPPERNTVDIRFSTVRSSRFWVSGYCTKWRIQDSFDSSSSRSCQRQVLG